MANALTCGGPLYCMDEVQHSGHAAPAFSAHCKSNLSPSPPSPSVTISVIIIISVTTFRRLDSDPTSPKAAVQHKGGSVLGEILSVQLVLPYQDVLSGELPFSQGVCCAERFEHG